MLRKEKMTKLEITCDECGARKGPNNGWFHLVIDDCFHLSPAILGKKWENQQDICSAGCALLALNKFVECRN